MKNIKLIRVINDYTQLKVEMETRISQSVLSKHETEEVMPTTQKLIIISKLYITSLDFLMDITDVQESYPKKKQLSPSI